MSERGGSTMAVVTISSWITFVVVMLQVLHYHSASARVNPIEVVVSETHVEAEINGSIYIHCSYRPVTYNLDEILWHYYPSDGGEEVFIYSKRLGKKEISSDRYRSMKLASLQIDPVQEEDSGNYSCTVRRPDNGRWDTQTKYISLNVFEPVDNEVLLQISDNKVVTTVGPKMEQKQTGQQTSGIRSRSNPHISLILMTLLFTWLATSFKISTQMS